MLNESPRVRADLRRARRAVEAGRPAASLPAFTRALGLDPDCAYGWFFRAGVRALRGDAAGAAADLAALGRLPASTLVRYREFDAPSVRRYPGYLAAVDALLARPRPPAWAYVLRAFALRESQRFAEAIAAVEKGASAAPRDAGLRAILARVRFVNRFPKEGLADLRAAVRLDPSCGWIRAWLGEALRHRGEPGAALAQLEKAIALDPGYFRSFAWRGGIRSARGEHALAIADFDRALSVDWSYCWAYRSGGREADPNLSWVFHERMRARRALGLTEAGLEDLGRAHALNNRYVWIHNPGGDAEAFAAAERELDGLLRRRPRHAWALAWRGWTRLESGRAALALADLDKAVSLGVDRSWPLVWRGRARLQLGRHAEALRDLSRAARLDPRYAPAWAWRGGVHRLLGRGARARADLSRAVALDPVCAWAWAWRGEAELERGALESAVADLGRALTLDPSNHDARLWRAEALRRLGRFAPAAADAEEASRQSPGSWRAWAALSLIRGAGGDARGQRLCLDRALALAPEDARRLVESA